MEKMNYTNEELYALANKARESSYCPYSGYSVGAALLTKTGKVYLGANIENASFSPTVCAERVAFFKAINEGERDFVAIAIAGGEVGKPAKPDFPPCGVCRQVMGEFCSPDFIVIWGNNEKITVKTLGEILPFGFNKSSL